MHVSQDRLESGLCLLEDTPGAWFEDFVYIFKRIVGHCDVLRGSGRGSRCVSRFVSCSVIRRSGSKIKVFFRREGHCHCRVGDFSNSMLDERYKHT